MENSKNVASSARQDTLAESISVFMESKSLYVRSVMGWASASMDELAPFVEIAEETLFASISEPVINAKHALVWEFANIVGFDLIAKNVAEGVFVSIIVYAPDVANAEVEVFVSIKNNGIAAKNATRAGIYVALWRPAYFML